MSEIVEHHQFRLEARVGGTSTDFEQFVEKTKSEICEKIDSARVLVEWAKKAERVRRLTENEMKEARRQEYVPRITLRVQTKCMASFLELFQNWSSWGMMYAMHNRLPLRF